MGFALQLCTVRYLRLFVEDPLDVPWPVVVYVAEHLGVEDTSCVKRYTERQMTAYKHAWEIRDTYGYHPFEDAESGRRFRTFLHAQAWTHEEGPVTRFNQAVGCCGATGCCCRGCRCRRGRWRRSGCTPR
ncbi:DUF4158 domain-containing protein [Nonomuraea sp. NPDC050451]|uniref:DUF4158 domain-containing protein n=1 Tax=Nonomuraea sp. NPDC050451 TaxID=3364364 RepID=UPI0037B14129